MWFCCRDEQVSETSCRMDEIKVCASRVVLRLPGFSFQMLCMDNGWMHPAASSLHPPPPSPTPTSKTHSALSVMGLREFILPILEPTIKKKYERILWGVLYIFNTRTFSRNAENINYSYGFMRSRCSPRLAKQVSAENKQQ